MASRPITSVRRAVCDALQIASPEMFDDRLRRSFLDDGANIALADLGLDSLARMEFCIALELSTGVTLLPAQLAELATTDAVERRIRQLAPEAAR